MIRSAVPACTALLLGLTLLSCTRADPVPPTDQPAHVAPDRPVPALGEVPADDKYAAAMDMFTARGIEVWVETDLVARWQEGPASFDDAISRVAALAQRPGVAGVKIADELGYHDGMDDALEIRQFLADTANDLRTLAPGTKILVDMVVPDLGCLPWLADELPQTEACAEHEAADTPAAAMAAVDGYLASGDIDVLDLSTGLREPGEYESWGTDRRQAQREAWAEAKRRGWAEDVRLQARKALAHPGSYTADAATAHDDVVTFVDLPVEAGAGAVDVWTWRQTYDGQVVRLLDPGLRPNLLWTELRAARDRGAFLLTHYTPSSVEVGPAEDLDRIAEVFRGVFVAAGTG